MQQRNAGATFLEGHSAVAKVHYNGLPSHPDYGISSSQMRQPGAVLSFELKYGLVQTKNFIDKLRVCVLGCFRRNGRHTCFASASMSHSGMTSADRLSSGITDGLIRMSVGLEDINDIINDLEKALFKIFIRNKK